MSNDLQVLNMYGHLYWEMSGWQLRRQQHLFSHQLYQNNNTRLFSLFSRVKLSKRTLELVARPCEVERDEWREVSASPPHSITGLKLKLGDCKTVSSPPLHRTTGCWLWLGGAITWSLLGMITLTGWIFKWPVGSQCVVWGGSGLVVATSGPTSSPAHLAGHPTSTQTTLQHSNTLRRRGQGGKKIYRPAWGRLTPTLSCRTDCLKQFYASPVVRLMSW